MIDQLESRTFLSTTPLAALTVLRSDVASVGHIVNTMIVANNSAIANLQSDMSIFPTALTSDKANLRLLNVRFRTSVATLSNVYNNIKLLLGQDISALIVDCNAYNRNPSVSLGQQVQAAEQLLTAQGQAAATHLTMDASLLQIGYQNALALISASHPLDSTLVTRVSHISTALFSKATAIYNVGNIVAQTDIPNFITALEPNGVITAAA